MKKGITTLILSFLVVSAVFLLGCKNQGGLRAKINKDVVYEYTTDITACKGLGNIPFSFDINGDRLLIFNRKYEIEEGTDRNIASWTICDLNNPSVAGELSEFHGSEEGKYVYFEDCRFTEDGKIYILEGDELEDSSVNYYLDVALENGTLESRTPIETDGFFVDKPVILKDGYTAFTVGSSVYIYGPDGKKYDEVKQPEGFAVSVYSGGKIVDCGNSLILVDGKIKENKKREYAIYNRITKTLGPVCETELSIHNAGELTEDTFYICSVEKGFYEMKYGESGEIQTLSYKDSDLPIVTMGLVWDINRMVLFVPGDDYVFKPMIYTKVNPEEVGEKTVITIGGPSYATMFLRPAVTEFNQKNKEYRIEIIDYYEENNSDFTAAMNAYRMDLLSGQGPDIIISDGYMDITNDLKTGVYEDMTPYMEAAGISSSDFLEQVEDVCCYDGKQYVYFPWFTVKGLCMTKPEYVNANQTLTIKEEVEFEKKYGIVGQGAMDCDRNELIMNSVLCSYRDYYNPDTGECNFDSDSFKEFLEWVATYPESLNEEQTYYSVQSQRKLFEENKVIYEEAPFKGFRNVYAEDMADFGGNAVIIGMPSKEGNKAGILYTDYILGINAGSSNKEGAFDFIKRFMTDEYYSNATEFRSGLAFPAKKNKFDELCENMLDLPYVYGNSGELVKGKDYYYDNGNRVEIDPPSAERMEHYKELVLNSHGLVQFDTKMLMIIQEETTPYFAGDKTVDEVARIIQSRAEMYVKER